MRGIGMMEDEKQYMHAGTGYHVIKETTGKSKEKN
jgi:hypothetical protein